MNHEQDQGRIWQPDTDANPPEGASESLADTSAPETQPTFPDEPFACPTCGQMLAATCRVCVACRQPIDSSQILRSKPRLAPTPALEISPIPQPLKPVSFPWPMFFAVLVIAFAVAMVMQAVWGVKNGTLVMGGATILSSVWVSFDASARRLPKPFRWGFGTMVLWCVFFPWYLARRKTPQSPCPFVEAEGRPVSSYWLLVLAAFVLQYALAAVLSRFIPQ